MSIALEQSQPWLYPSHQVLYDGIAACFGVGEFEARRHVPVHIGRLVLNNTDELTGVDKGQTALLQIAVDQSSATATLSEVRRDDTNEESVLSGIVMATGRRDEFAILAHAAKAATGYRMTVLQGQPYQLQVLNEDGGTIEMELPDYRIAENFIDAVAIAVKGQQR